MPSADPGTRSLQLSQEEALTLLDLCLLSHGENDAIKNKAIMKLCDFVRRNITASLDQEAESENSGTNEHFLRQS